MGLVTTLYAIGQALGPPMVAALLRLTGDDAHLAFQRSLVVAAGALLLGTAMYLAAARTWPSAAAPA
jgi:hypothetical protein